MHLKFSLILLVLSVALGLPAANRDVRGRRNIAEAKYGTTITLNGKILNGSRPEGAIDGSIADTPTLALGSTPSEIILQFSAARPVSSIRLYTGVIGNLGNPSGACCAASYRLDGFINNGWTPIAQLHRAMDAPEFPAPSERGVYIQHDFRPQSFEAIRLTLLKSHDTGKRISAPDRVTVPEAERVIHLREIQVFEEESGTVPADTLPGVLTGDFRLPIYENASRAGLHLFVEKPLQIELQLLETDGKTPRGALRSVGLNAGENIVDLEIGDVPEGRYPVVIRARDRDALPGEMRRLLRIQRTTPPHPPAGVLEMTGKKLFPFDDWEIAEQSGLTLKVNPAETHQVTRPLSPERRIQRAWKLNFTEEGGILIEFQDYTAWNTDPRTHYAYAADPARLDDWKISDEKPAVRIVPRPVPPQPAWRPKTADSAARFRFYDPAADGVVPLNEIFVKYTSVKQMNFSGLPIPFRSTYAVWEKTPGEVLFLTREPLLVDQPEYGADEFEFPNASNDNFGGQYLCDDGKTLVYCRALAIRRFAPYIARYDNLWQLNRILHVFSTTDGFHWQKRAIALPGEDDSWAMQHYGANLFKVEDSDLWFGFLFHYDAFTQRIRVDVMFSRDGLSWKRPPRSVPFIANSEIPGDWNFGISFLDDRPEIRDGRAWHVMGHNRSGCHFYPWSPADAGQLRQRFESRDLKKWPFFQAVGGWDGLSKLVNEMYFSVGLAVYRPEGWIALSAGDAPGVLRTRPLRANGGLALNARTAPGGSILVECEDESGRLLPEYRREFTGDAVSAAVLDRLPEGVFRLKLTLHNAELFTIRF